MRTEHSLFAPPEFQPSVADRCHLSLSCVVVGSSLIHDKMLHMVGVSPDRNLSIKTTYLISGTSSIGLYNYCWLELNSDLLQCRLSASVQFDQSDAFVSPLFKINKFTFALKGNKYIM